MLVKLSVNRRPYEVDVRPHWTLAQVLRDRLGLTGTKMGCGLGHCGSCTVIMDGKTVFSCMMLAVEAEGHDILTIEGLAEGARLHPLQDSFIDHHAMQCAFCTSGMLMSAKALLDTNPDPTEQQVREAISGNLCRCGTYPKIVEAVLAAGKAVRGER